MTQGGNGVWVLCEQRGGRVTEDSLRLLGAGRRLADARGTELSALLLGFRLGAKQTAALGNAGADRVYLCDDPLLADYATEPYTRVLCSLAEERKPEILLLPATATGRDLAPRAAARLRTGLTADCTALALDAETGCLKMTLPAFGGRLMADIVCPERRPQMATVRPGAAERAPASAARAAAVERVAARFAPADRRAVLLGTEPLPAEAGQGLAEAETVVAVGRGILRDGARGLAVAEDLAAALGGVVGATRPVVEAGLLGGERQIGQTGVIVRPRLYVALGVSGAIQHLAGMQDSDCIVAVNKNPGAPIFVAATYGIAGDLFEVAPRLAAAIRAHKSAGKNE